jgi:hypothetical protein
MQPCNEFDNEYNIVSTKDEHVDRGFQLDGRYNLSELGVVFKIAVRIDNLVECKNSVDDWL